MAKIKGGLGKNALIQDLTEPIKFHISDVLEPPPVYERRKKTAGESQPEIEKRKNVLPDELLALVGRAEETAGGSGMEVVLNFKGHKNALLIACASEGKDKNYTVKSVLNNKGEYTEILWNDSIFCDSDFIGEFRDMKRQICGVEIITDDDYIKFSSIDDLCEWIEM